MKPILKLKQFVVLGVFLFSCDSNDNLPVKDDPCAEGLNLVITSTKVCGWVPNYDSMSIDRNSLKYYNYCMADAPIREYPITCDEWSTLISDLNIEEFWGLDINTCNLCADGCDISISIKDQDRVHGIKFGPDEVPVLIKEFVDKIETLRAATKTKVCS